MCHRRFYGADAASSVILNLTDAVRATQVPGADPRIYEEVSDMSQLQPTIEEYLNDYNAESKQPMPLGTVWKSIASRYLGAAAL